ncbi:LacI family DNA-binding transcriptional regulator [Sphingobacterium hungaricum]
MKENQEKPMIGVKEIARRANVSIATVDRVLHKRSGVSKATKEKIEAIIAELNYQPNIFARTLSSNKTLKIAALLPKASPESAFWNAPLEGIQQAASEISPYGLGIDVFLFDQNDKNTFESQANAILEKDYQAVLLAPMFMAKAKKFIQSCHQSAIPYVFINSDIPGQDSLAYYGPDLFQSGYMGGHLLRYIVPASANVLLVNISKEIDAHHHLLRKEEGVREYFSEHELSQELHRLDIRNTDYVFIAKALDQFFASQHDITAIFVTNSRVSSVAKYLEERGLSHLILVGFDFLPENIEYLKTNVIDFLICQKPYEQGYKGIMALYQHLIHHIDPKKVNFMPIDVISRENYMFYTN